MVRLCRDAAWRYFISQRSSETGNKKKTFHLLLNFIMIQPIGLINTPFTSLEDMPIQPKGAKNVVGRIVINQEHQEGLTDLQGFSHIYLIYQFHQAKRTALTVTPFMDTTPRGVFATRSPLRPNHIGLSIVELLSIDNNVLEIQGIDVLDGTPLLDIKPYIAAFDEVAESKSGWMKGSRKDIEEKRSDGRFVG